MLLEEEEEKKERKEEGKEEPYAKWRIKSSKSMSGSVCGSTWRGWVIKGESGENTIPESRCCSDSCLKKTEVESVGVLFKLSVRELSGELFDIKLLMVRELFDIKPLVEKLFFHFIELFFSKMFIESREEEREEKEKVLLCWLDFGHLSVGMFWSYCSLERMIGFFVHQRNM
jgi:hypothetical protein